MPPVDFQLERLDTYLTWCKEHFLSFRAHREVGETALAEDELAYLHETILKARRHFARLTALVRSGHSPLQEERDREPPLGDPRRLDWLRERASSLEPIVVAARGGPFRCPCCGLPYLRARGSFEVCPVCLWEDDGQDDPHAELVRGGPNGKESLSSARANFERLGVFDARLIGKGRARRVETSGLPACDDTREDFKKTVD